MPLMKKKKKPEQVLGECITKESDSVIRKGFPEKVILKHQDSQVSGEKSKCKGPVAGPMIRGDHIFPSVLGCPSSSGLFIVSSLFFFLK